eukprot:13358_1
MNILLCLLAVLSVVLIMAIAYCYFCRIKWNQILYGPCLFLYKYHVGPYYKMISTFKPFQDAVEESNTKEMLANAFNIPINEIKLIPAALYVEDPGTVKSSQLHTAVGFIVKLKNDTEYWKVNKDKLLQTMSIDLARIRFWPKCNWIVAFYPRLKWLDPFSFIIGIKRVLKFATKKNWIKAPPMEIFPGNAKEFTGESDGLITYVLTQDHTDLYHMDPHICTEH